MRKSWKERVTASGLWRSDEDPGRTQTRGETMARGFIRVTARVSLSAFLVSFTAPALQRLRPSPVARALADRRFEALAAVTAIELVHGLGIASLLVVYTREGRRLPPLPLLEALGGAVGYGVLL